MATWNTDNPAVGNQITADIADIEENLQELHDVITAITNGTLGTTTATDFQVDAVSTPAIWLDRARFEWKDADEIYIHAGAYHHVGTVSQVVYWNTKLTSDIGSPDASDWYYLYLDDSAIVTADTNLLTTTELLWSNTEPAWSDAKHGWYNGEDKCIFAVYSDASNNISEFWHDGGDQVLFFNTNDPFSEAPTDTYADVTLLVPKFSTKASISCTIIVSTGASDGSTYVYLRPKGSTVDILPYGVTTYHDPHRHVFMTPMFTDTSQRIQIKQAITNVYVEVNISVRGWYYPTGM